MLITVAAFAVTLGLLVVIHEYGHYRVARWCGVRVLRFSVGFGPVIWRRKPASAGGTEFTLSALPLGGYVRMLDTREGAVPASLVPEAFDRKPLRCRVAIVAAGPIANLLLAAWLYACAHWWGMDEPRAVLSAPPAATLLAQADARSGDLVQAWSRNPGEWQAVQSMVDLRWALTQAAVDGESIQLEVSDRDGRNRRFLRVETNRLAGEEVNEATVRRLGLAGAFSEPVIGEVRVSGAAHRAGLQAGDRVLAIDGVSVPDSVTLRDRVRGHAVVAQPAMVWEIERLGRPMTLRVEPQVIEEGGQRRGRIDAYIGRPPEMVTTQLGAWEGAVRGVAKTWEMSSLTLRMIGRMIIGEASLKNLSGPLSIAEGAGQTARLGLAYYLGFLAVVSVSLGVLNLLPLPMLDGGHLLYYLFEGVTGRPVPELWLARFQRGGVALLLLIMFIALSNDVARLLGSQ